MLSLFASIAQRFGRKSFSDEDVAKILADHDERLRKLEDGLAAFTAAFERELDEFSQRAQKAKAQTSKELDALATDLDRYIAILVKVTEGELTAARRREVQGLLKSARQKRTRINNVLIQKAVNDR